MKTFTVIATLGGREVRDAGLTIVGSGRGRAVEAFDAEGELRRYPLKGRTVEQAVAAVGLKNLRDCFKGPLSGVVRIESYNEGRMLQVLAEEAGDLLRLPASNLFGAAHERLMEEARA